MPRRSATSLKVIEPCSNIDIRQQFLSSLKFIQCLHSLNVQDWLFLIQALEQESKPSVFIVLGIPPQANRIYSQSHYHLTLSFLNFPYPA